MTSTSRTTATVSVQAIDTDVAIGPWQRLCAQLSPPAKVYCKYSRPSWPIHTGTISTRGYRAVACETYAIARGSRVRHVARDMVVDHDTPPARARPGALPLGATDLDGLAG